MHGGYAEYMAARGGGVAVAGTVVPTKAMPPTSYSEYLASRSVQDAPPTAATTLEASTQAASPEPGSFAEYMAKRDAVVGVVEPVMREPEAAPEPGSFEEYMAKRTNEATVAAPAPAPANPRRESLLIGTHAPPMLAGDGSRQAWLQKLHAPEWVQEAHASPAPEDPRWPEPSPTATFTSTADAYQATPNPHTGGVQWPSDPSGGAAPSATHPAEANARDILPPLSEQLETAAEQAKHAWFASLTKLEAAAEQAKQAWSLHAPPAAELHHAPAAAASFAPVHELYQPPPPVAQATPTHAAAAVAETPPTAPSTPHAAVAPAPVYAPADLFDLASFDLDSLKAEYVALTRSYAQLAAENDALRQQQSVAEATELWARQEQAAARGGYPQHPYTPPQYTPPSEMLPTFSKMLRDLTGV